MVVAKPVSVIIIGAGLGGLTAACQLSRCGHKVQVLERSKSLSVASGAIYVRSNALRCIDRWQMLDHLRVVATDIEHFQFRTAADNTALNTVPNGTYSIYSDMATDREALQNMWYEQACNAGAEILFGVQIVDVAEDGDQAYAIDARGVKHAADLLMAADGISSRLRARVLSHRKVVTPIALPSTHYPTEIPKQALLSNHLTKSLAEGEDSVGSMFWAGNGGYAVGNFNKARELFNLMWSIQHTSTNDDAGDDPRLFDEIGEPERVRDFFGQYHPVLKSLTEMTTTCSRWRLARLEPLDTWSSPGCRLALLGDSAHGMLPNLAQGYSTIVEDVEALSLLLAEGWDVRETIAAWEALRIPRASKIQACSLNNYSIYNQGKVPGDEELTDAERALPMGEGDEHATFNTRPFLKWVYDYDTAAHVQAYVLQRQSSTAAVRKL